MEKSNFDPDFEIFKRAKSHLQLNALSVEESDPRHGDESVRVGQFGSVHGLHAEQLLVRHRPQTSEIGHDTLEFYKI